MRYAKPAYIIDGNLRVHIFFDEDARNPRADGGCMAILVIDKPPRGSMGVDESPGVPLDAESSMFGPKASEILMWSRVFCLSHSGNTYSLAPFGSEHELDSWACGHMALTRESALELLKPAMESTGMTFAQLYAKTETVDSLKSLMAQELKSYNDWCSGNVYEYRVELLGDDGVVVSSETMCGLFDLDYAESAAEEAARALVKQLPLPMTIG